MDKLIDLHAHTSFSDGELTPQELIDLAKERNVGTIAITDHNTINGVKNLLDSNYNLNGINFIPGIELSAKVSKGQFHILGLGIDPYNESLNNKMYELRTNSLNYILSIIEQIKRDYDIVFSYNELVNLFTANHNLGRPDVARLCLEKGLVSTIQEAFTKYLNPAKECIRGKNKELTYEDCIDLILKSGGIPVLAHPISLKLDKKEFLILLKNMIECGLKGLEVYHPTMNDAEREIYKNIALEYDLFISGGTDYHGPIVKPSIELGTGKDNNIKIKQLSILEGLKKY